jgi:glutathione peroxidase-family protein
MKKTFTVIAGLLVVIAALFINANVSMGDAYEVGDYVQDFELTNVDGRKVSLSSFSNAKGFIITFTCNTCPYAKGYEQRIMDLDRTYAGQGFPVIAINPNDVSRVPDDSMEAMRVRSQEMGYTFPYVRDDSQAVAQAFGASKTPHVYVVSKNNGRYRVEYIGAIDDNPRDANGVSERYVEDAVKALLAGRSPEIKEKRAIGCTIKWKES